MEWEKKPRSRRRLFQVTAVFVGLLVGLGTAEIVIRLRGSDMRTKRMLQPLRETGVIYHCYSSNPTREFQPVPEVSHDGSWRLTDFMLEPTVLSLSRLSETPYCVKLEFSPEGFRDARSYSPEPPVGKLRIAVVGDSFVAGEGVPANLTLPRKLEGLLGEDYQVLNAGRSGADTFNEVLLLKEIVKRWKFRRALFVFIANDVQLTPQLNSQQGFINDLINIRDRYLEYHERRAWYKGHSRLLDLVGSAREMSRIEAQTVQWYKDCYDERLNGANIQQMKASIQQLANMPNCEVAFVMYPLMIGLEGEYPLQSIHDLAGQMAKEAGLPVLDLAPVFQGRRTHALHAHPTDHHPNGTAHQIAAEAIVEWLRTELPEFLEPDEPAISDAEGGNES